MAIFDREIDVNPNFKESPFSTKDNGGFITAGMHVDEYENLINKELKYANIEYQNSKTPFNTFYC